MLPNAIAPITVHVRFDSYYAAKSILGMCNGPKNKAQIDKIREIFHQVTNLKALGINPVFSSSSSFSVPPLRMEPHLLYRLVFTHVKGHNNFRWNERADALATRGKQGVVQRGLGSLLRFTDLWNEDMHPVGEEDDADANLEKNVEMTEVVVISPDPLLIQKNQREKIEVTNTPIRNSIKDKFIRKMKTKATASQQHIILDDDDDDDDDVDTFVQVNDQTKDGSRLHPINLTSPEDHQASTPPDDDDNDNDMTITLTPVRPTNVDLKSQSSPIKRKRK